MFVDNDTGSSSSSSSVELLNLTDFEPDLLSDPRSAVSSTQADLLRGDAHCADSDLSRTRLGTGAGDGGAGGEHALGGAASSAFSGTAASESAGFVSVGSGVLP